MYSIQKKDYGYKIVFSGFIQEEEMKNWFEDSKTALQFPPNKEFVNFIDMRELKPLPPEARAIIEKGQELYKNAGMIRSVVIVENAMTKIQFKSVAKESGIYQYERYFATAETPDWEKKGLDWIISGIDPDKNK